MGEVGKGFSPSAFGDRFEKEVREGCTGKLPGQARSHPGARAVSRGRSQPPRRRQDASPPFRTCRPPTANFADIKIDCRKEFWEAIRLGDFDTADNGFAEITHRRIYSRPKPPEKAISTIHKAKGLECESVIVMPCDAKNFPDKPEARCLLYVALSRAKSRLMLVVSHTNPSPLLTI